MDVDCQTVRASWIKVDCQMVGACWIDVGCLSPGHRFMRVGRRGERRLFRGRRLSSELYVCGVVCVLQQGRNVLPPH